MSVLIRLAKGLWGLIIGAIADAVEWLRKPGSKIKMVCAVLAFGFMVAGLSAYEKEQRIQQLAAQVIRIQADWDADAARLQSDVEERDARLAEVAAVLRTEADKLETLKAESAAALNGLASKIEAAEKDATTWRERYQKRPDSCQAALELLDSACPGLIGY